LGVGKNAAKLFDRDLLEQVKDGQGADREAQDDLAEPSYECTS
jgi:hypothetical protein